jgi:hypothetical protein
VAPAEESGVAFDRVGPLPFGRKATLTIDLRVPGGYPLRYPVVFVRR